MSAQVTLQARRHGVIDDGESLVVAARVIAHRMVGTHPVVPDLSRDRVHRWPLRCPPTGCPARSFSGRWQKCNSLLADMRMETSRRVPRRERHEDNAVGPVHDNGFDDWLRARNAGSRRRPARTRCAWIGARRPPGARHRRRSRAAGACDGRQAGALVRGRPDQRRRRRLRGGRFRAVVDLGVGRRARDDRARSRPVRGGRARGDGRDLASGDREQPEYVGAAMSTVTAFDIARVAYEARRFYALALQEPPPPPWEEAPPRLQTEAILGAEAVLTGEARSGAHLHDAWIRRAALSPVPRLAPGYEQLDVDQRRKVLLF